jgi:hypothetical protein
VARTKNGGGWLTLFVILLLILALAWFFRPYLERRFLPKNQPKPILGKEKVQEQITEEDRKKLEEILKRK